MIIRNTIISKSAVFSSIEISLYEFALKNIQVKKCEKIEEFERVYLVKMVINF
jgi:hypothetical protein